MLDEFYSAPFARARLRTPPLGAFLDDHAAFLVGQGYAPESIRAHFTILRRFNIWLAIQRIAVAAINESVIQHYVRDLAEQYHTTKDTEPIRILLRCFRTTGVNRTSTPHPPNTPTERLVQGFVSFLRDERGLSEQSIKYYALFAQRFLSRPCAAQRTPPSRLRPKDVVEYVRQLPRGKGARLSIGMAALRLFFRYLHYVGRTKSDLSSFVPSVAKWRGSSVPAALSMRDLRLLLRQCDRRTALGRRDYAVLLLLSRLGLRSGEVQRLTLDDFDWDKGVVTIRGKGQRVGVLPLPEDVGRAIVVYLERDRPSCSTRHVFVRDRAPVQAWANASAVCSLVRRVFRKTALQYPRIGPHLLRHTCATHLLHRGRSLEEIGQVLRHAHINSTATYAKVNETELRKAAGFWPGGQR